MDYPSKKKGFEIMSKKYTDDINAITSEIEKRGDNQYNLWELYYQRGYLFFLNNEDDKAKADYKKAESLGLDVTELPYYSFSNSNSKRREFLLPEKILVFLILLMVLAAIGIQILSFVYNIKAAV